MTSTNDSLEPSGANSETKPSLLVLDDEVSVRRLLVRLLSRDGYEIHESATIEHAYSTAHSLARLDVWVTDANVDGNDASAQVERFRALHPHLAVVLISGCEPERDRADRLELLGVKFLAKPFSQVQLREAIGTAMRHGSATSTVVPFVAETAFSRRAP
jgi:DNA-binding NtrC family response regulator